ncbi:MAG: class I adenylate-forming enzyme family protein [Acidimicrobiales bacterium]
MLFSIADCIAANAVAFPARIAIEVLDPRRYPEPVRRFTYRGLWQAVCVLADAFGYVEAGRHGPMVATLLPNGSGQLISYLAAQVAGVTAVPLDGRRGHDELAYILRDCEASVLVAAGSSLDAAHALAHELGLRVLDLGRVDLGGEHLDYLPGSRDSGRTPAVVAYTAGTTGFPKGMFWSNQDWLLRLFRSGWAFGVSPDHTVSMSGPLLHVPFGGMALGALIIGARVRIITDFELDVALQEYARHCTWVCLTPAVLGAVTERWHERGRPSLDAVRLLLTTGSAGPVPLLEAAFDLFPRARITEAYGWIEGGWICHEVKDREALVPNSVGWPIVGAEISIRDDNGLTVADGGRGELRPARSCRSAGTSGRSSAPPNCSPRRLRAQRRRRHPARGRPGRHRGPHRRSHLGQRPFSCTAPRWKGCCAAIPTWWTWPCSAPRDRTVRAWPPPSSCGATRHRRRRPPSPWPTSCDGAAAATSTLQCPQVVILLDSLPQQRWPGAEVPLGAGAQPAAAGPRR